LSISANTLRAARKHSTPSGTPGATPTATFALSGLPGTSSGSLACWIATIDLDSPPQPASLAFTLHADGDGTYQAVPQDHFQWSISSSLTTSMSTGPILAGDPATCPYGAGTRFDPAQPGPGTGLGAVDSFRIAQQTFAELDQS